MVTRPGKQECLGKPLIQSNSQQFVWLEELLTMSQFKKCLMNALQLTMTHIETEDSPWQLLLGKTPTDKTACEDPDLAQCSVEVVDEIAKQRLRVKGESYKAYIDEELSLRKRRKEIHQARPWRHRAAGEWCWYWRSDKHKGSRMKGGVFLGPARVLLQEREPTAEGGRMKGVVWITEGTSLVRCAVQHLRSLSETQKPSFSKTLSDICHTAHFLISRHRQMPLMTFGKKKSLVGTHEAREIQAVAVLSAHINLMQHHAWDLTWCHQVDR